MKAYGGVDVQIQIVLTSALGGGEWSTSRPGRFTPDTHWIGSVDLKSRSGRFGEEKILGPIGTRTPTPWSSSP
jgi:hypothetical protein